MRTLMAADNFMTVTYDDDSSAPETSSPVVTVHIDRARLVSSARPAIASLMTNLHVWRCSADGPAAKKFYGQLTKVEGFWLQVREVVVRKVKNQAPRIFVQANTFLENGGEGGNGEVQVRIVEYDTTVQGVIQSWCEREV
jgi:dipeptidyl-peptidase-3